MTVAGAAPLVVDVKRGSLDDGPGIRSVVFFKGCPLRCAWCQNPETMRAVAEIQRLPESCVRCSSCAAACPVGRARPALEAEPDVACRVCGACVEACPSASRRIAGEAIDADALAARLVRDEVFFRRSGGGVTLSGGEPALFPAFAGRVAGALRARGIHVLLETCGHFRWEELVEHLLPHLSAIWFDLKIADRERHRRWVGRDNATIHENFRRLARAGGPELLPRVPLVPALTDDEDNLRALGALVLAAGLRRIALLPYNPLWVSKRRALGLEMPYDRRDWMSPQDVRRCEGIVEALGLEIFRA